MRVRVGVRAARGNLLRVQLRIVERREGETDEQHEAERVGENEQPTDRVAAHAGELELFAVDGEVGGLHVEEVRRHVGEHDLRCTPRAWVWLIQLLALLTGATTGSVQGRGYEGATDGIADASGGRCEGLPRTCKSAVSCAREQTASR